jgi:hypothetical protein
MAHATDGDAILAVLRGASVLGIHLADAADVYSWGLTREFAAVRAACRAHLAAVGVRRADSATHDPLIQPSSEGYR